MGGKESSETMTDAERTISDATDSSRLIMAVRICNSALLVHAPSLGQLGWVLVVGQDDFQDDRLVSFMAWLRMGASLLVSSRSRSRI